MFKHCLAAEALAEEAVTLSSDSDISKTCSRLSEFMRWVWCSLQGDCDPTSVACSIRSVRKGLMPMVSRFKIATKVASKHLKATQGAYRHVGFFIPVPEPFRDQYPERGDIDPSPPHVTLLYVGEVSEDQKQDLVDIAIDVLGRIEGPVLVRPMGIGHFDIPESGHTVVYERVRFSHDLAKYRSMLYDALVEAGFDVQDSHPLAYSPHISLYYRDLGDREKSVSVGNQRWSFDSIQIWGFDDEIDIPLTA